MLLLTVRSQLSQTSGSQSLFSWKYLTEFVEQTVQLYIFDLLQKLVEKHKQVVPP